MKILSVLLLLAGFTFAQDTTRKTEITINEPVIVVGVKQVTLQPGKYTLKQLTHEHTRNIIQIFDSKNKLVTTVMAINNYRLKPANKTSLQFWETPKGNPPALRAWFAPGDEWGQEFVYPKGLATKIARESGGPVLTARVTTEAELSTAPVTEVTKSGEEKPLEEAYVEPAAAPVQVAQAARPAPATAVAAAAAQAPAPAAAKAPAPSADLLPATGSPVFGIGLGGLLLAAIGFALRRALSVRA